MPLDANLDFAYFMKNRDRLLKLIEFLKKNPEVSDENIGLRSIQEKITRNGLGLRNTYSVSAMACIPQFIAEVGGVDYFRTAPLEMIAGHRALALYIIHYLEDVPEVPGKCPYFKCSLVTSEKLYRSIFRVGREEKVSKEEIKSMQHVLQSTNYFNDYFYLKEVPFDPSWSEEDTLNRVREFIQQQISFDEKKKDRIPRRTEAKTENKAEGGAQMQERKNQNGGDTPARDKRDKKNEQTQKMPEETGDTALYQSKETMHETQAPTLKKSHGKAIDRAPAQALKKKGKSTISEQPARRTCSKTVDRARVVETERRPTMQPLRQGEEALEHRSATCTNNLQLQAPRSSSRKIKPRDRLNL